MGSKVYEVGQLVLVGGVNGVKAAEVKTVTDTQVKVGWRYYRLADGLSVEADGVATTCLVPNNGGFSDSELQKLLDAQEYSRVFLADIPLAQYKKAAQEGNDFNNSLGIGWVDFVKSVPAPGLTRQEFGGIAVVIRVREAKGVETLVDEKLVKGKGWEAYVKATDNLNEDSETATVVHGDLMAAIGLAAKEVYAKLPW